MTPLDTTTLEDNKKRKNHKGDCRSRINRSFAMTDDGNGDCHGRFTASQRLLVVFMPLGKVRKGICLTSPNYEIATLAEDHLFRDFLLNNLKDKKKKP